MTWVNGRIAASVGTADSYVSFPILYLFIFRKTLVAKIRIIFSDQAHSSLKKRGFAKIQNNDEPSTPTGVELQVTAMIQCAGRSAFPIHDPNGGRTFLQIIWFDPVGVGCIGVIWPSASL